MIIAPFIFDGPMIYDYFRRADNATSPGAADSGQFWTIVTGTWGIIGNQLYEATTTSGDRRATVNYAFPGPVEIRAGIVWYTGERAGVTFRGTSDQGSYFNLYLTETSQLILARKDASFTTLGTLSTIGTSGALHELRVVLRGSNITCYLNGVQMFNVTDSNFVAETIVGFFKNSVSSSKNQSRFNYLTVGGI